jgi:hypothetical protein
MMQFFKGDFPKKVGFAKKITMYVILSKSEYSFKIKMSQKPLKKNDVYNEKFSTRPFF